MSDVLVFVEWWNVCCRDNTTQDVRFISHEHLVELQKQVGVMWVVDESELHKVTGDDWNDAPSCSNAGKPYLDSAKTLRAIPIIMGMPLESLANKKVIPAKDRKKYLHM